MDPNEIITLFKEKWVGTAEELSVAIDYFFCDIRSSVEMVADETPPEGKTRAQHITDVVNDYYANHYGEDAIEAEDA